ncbi:MAG: O-antigen polymerase family protein [Chloroflexi bacterium]|nr:MAG: O-antigen polymerase family protein [Chloroflexota bacterium]
MNFKPGKIEMIWQKGTWVLWLGLVATLPITSFPIFAKTLHTSSVAPASGMFLILLSLLWLPFFIIKKGRIPFQIRPAIVFFLLAFVSIFLAFFRNLPDYKNQSVISSAIEGVATLGLGALFYVVTTSIVNTSSKIQKTLAVLNWGGLVLLLWSLLQIMISFLTNDYPVWMRLFQRVFSTTVLFDHRATGFASEPSWLAHQLNLVYLAYWISATINKYSAHKFRIWKLTFENTLLAAGIVVLFASFSRGGLAAFMLVLAFLFIRVNIKFVNWLLMKWKARNRILVRALVAVGMALLYAVIALFGLYVLSKVDPRMEKVFQISTVSENPLLKYAENLQFGERVVYWQTGWNIFNDYPVLGVGVGFAGFYFPEYLPDYAWKLPEVRSLLYRSTGLLNIKSLWSRILAETGIAGFSFFVIFLVVTGITAKMMLSSRLILKRTIGWMGIFMLIAFLIEGFSMDSFALPYYWFTLGLVAAAWRWADPNISENKNG